MSNGLIMPPPSRGSCENEMGLYCKVVASVRILAVPGLIPIMHFVRVTVLSPSPRPLPKLVPLGSAAPGMPLAQN